MTDIPAEPELPRAVALAWGVAANPQRGPKREMSIERIVDAAIEIADAGGLAAVSMASVASALGYTPMSLYRYVTSKDDLLVLMQETGVGVPPESVLAMFVGALVFFIMGRRHKTAGSKGWRIWVDGMEPICAGLISGAALMGIGNAIINVLI